MFYITMAALAVMSLFSCEKEQDFNDVPLGKNEFRIYLHGSASTRSQEVMTPQSFSYLAGKVESTGESFYWEEVVEDLNYSGGLSTRGTPVYTENVGKLYDDLTVIAKGGASDISTQFWVMDNAQQEGAGWRYQGEFTWDQDSYDFYMGMPVDMTNYGVSNVVVEDKAITFDYASPTTEDASAASQRDLIFAAQTITKQQAEANRVNGVPVLFYHALTGVKFRIANNDELTHGKEGHTQTYITKVTIKGLKNSGSCIVTPEQEVEEVATETTFASGVVSWTYEEGTSVFSQTFTEAQNITQYTGGSFENKGNYPESFSGAANTYNLNDGDASMTFWFIPQALTTNVEIEVEFHVWSGSRNEDTHTLTLKLGEEVLKKEGKDLILTRDWKAGQLRTFSLKPLHVDVELEDEMDANKWIKSDVYIKNTGNVAEYVRIYMIGNWVGKRQIKAGVYNDYETVLMGYTDDTLDEHGQYANHDEVERWNDKDFTWNGDMKEYPKWKSPGGEFDYEPYGVFDGLPAMGSSTEGGETVRNWIRHDKFYYYKLPIGPGDDLPDTDPLFFSYEIGASPVFFIADNTGVRRKAKDVHFVMDLMVQAIEAPMNEDGTPAKTYLEAWTAELNPEGSPNYNPNFNINDL